MGWCDGSEKDYAHGRRVMTVEQFLQELSFEVLLLVSVIRIACMFVVGTIQQNNCTAFLVFV